MKAYVRHATDFETVRRFAMDKGIEWELRFKHWVKQVVRLQAQMKIYRLQVLN